MTEVWNQTFSKIVTLYFKGSVVVTTHGAHKYVSDEWRDVTKLSYTVTVNGSSPETLKISPPSFDTMEAELKKVNKAQCPCYAKKAQKEYLLGTKTSIKVNKVQEALMSAWTSKNPGTIHSLLLSIFCLEIFRSLGRKITRNFETMWVSSVKMW